MVDGGIHEIVVDVKFFPPVYLIEDIYFVWVSDK